MAYPVDELDITRHRRFLPDDPDLAKIRNRWEQALRQAVARLPDLRFNVRAGAKEEESIQLVDRNSAEGPPELQPQAGVRPSPQSL
jgi:predicted proteasome-type protease